MIGQRVLGMTDIKPCRGKQQEVFAEKMHCLLGAMAKSVFGFVMPIAFAAVLFPSCNGQSVFLWRASGATVLELDGFDPEIQKISENARNTVSIFFTHLNMPEKGESGFAAKYAFPVEGEPVDSVSTEEVWLSSISLTDGKYYGVVTNSPKYLADMNRGDKVEFDASAISDWMFLRSGKIIGGYSIKYLLEKVPEAERSSDQKKILQMFE